MPGPFPGMDPYLEDPSIWAGLHDGLIYTLSTALNALLPEGYYSRRQARLYVVQENRDIVPDVITFHRGQTARQAAPSRGGTGLTIERPSSVLLRVDESEISESYLEIRHKAETDTVVTVVEILSPSNKAQGFVGNYEYKRKQQQVLATDVNLIEIDLLRNGTHTVTPFRESIQRQFGDWDYLVSSSRAVDRSQYELWLISLRQRLPEINVPLLPGQDDVLLDLQAALDRCYDEDRYAESIRYDRDPQFPLSSQHSEWARELLVEAGLVHPNA